MEKLRKKSGTAQNCTKKQPPRFAAQNCAVKRGGCLCPLAGCNSIACDRHVVSSLMSYRPLAGCDVMRLATFSQFKWNFQRPLAGCNPSTKPCSPKLFGSILRPLAGCDCPLWRAFMPERRAISYVPLRGVISISGSTKNFHGEVVSYVPLRGVIL